MVDERIPQSQAISPALIGPVRLPPNTGFRQSSAAPYLPDVQWNVDMTTGQCWWASSAEISEVEVEAEVLEVAATLEITEIEAAGMETEGLEVATAPEITEMEAAETTPRPRPLSKGKGQVIYSDDEENMGESSGRPPTPRAQEAHEP